MSRLSSGLPQQVQHLPKELVIALSPAHPPLGSSLADLRLGHPLRCHTGKGLMTVLDKLPAARYIREMLRLLDRDGALVVTGETGSGKSTVLPLFTSAENDDVDVIVAVPRIQAAERLAIWLSEVVQQPVGKLVGFHTGLTKCVSDKTRLTYTTTGVAQMRELLGQTPRRRIVFVDEAHERNLDQDMLLAFLREEQKRNPLLQVVVMSATIKSDRFAEYLGGCKVLNIKGRNFPITRVAPEATLAEDVTKFVREGKSILICLPGKLEIDKEMSQIEFALQSAGLNAVVLPLHKDVPAAQQQECFKNHGKPKVILATNIAESSLTIEDLDVAIDLGLRRRTYLNNGVQCLGTVYATQFESRQFEGRISRTKPGISVRRCAVPLDQLPLAPQPEILRLQPTNALLKFLAFQEIHPGDMKLLDDPGVGVWDTAEADLKELGLIDSGQKATRMGQEVARLPISVNLGRMLYAAAQERILRDDIWVAAAIEVNGLQERDSSAWRLLFVDAECESELVLQRKLFQIGQSLSEAGASEQEFSDKGISYKNFIKAQEHSAELVRRLELMGWKDASAEPRSKNVEHALGLAFLAGFPNSIFVKKGNSFIGYDGAKRQLHGQAQVSIRQQFVAGIPWDYNPEVESEGGRPRHYINFGFPVSGAEAMNQGYVRDLLQEKSVVHKERRTHLRVASGRYRKRVTGRHGKP